MYCALLCSILGQSEDGQIGQNNAKRSIIIRFLGEQWLKNLDIILILGFACNILEQPVAGQNNFKI